MTLTAADRQVQAVLRERAAARAEYEQAVAEGKRAAIAEEERPDVFTMRVGNILPGERVSVELSLAGPLSYEDGAATFRFPLVVAPRYIPGEPLDGRPVGDGYAPDTDAVPDASRSRRQCCCPVSPTRSGCPSRSPGHRRPTAGQGPGPSRPPRTGRGRRTSG